MKQYLITAALCFFTGVAALSQVPYQIKGTWENGKGKKAYLSAFPSGTPEFVIIDSTLVDENGSYTLSGKLDKMQLVSVSFEGDKRYRPLMANGKPVTVNVQEVKYAYQTPTAGFEIIGDTLEHSAANEILHFWGNDFVRKVSLGMTEGAIEKAIQANNPAEADANKKKRQNMLDEDKNEKNAFIARYGNCLAAPFFIEMNMIKASPVEDIAEFYNKLGEKARTSPKGLELKNDIEKMQALAPGAKAPEFTLPTVSGENISLRSLQGHIVVLDFWASWCGPCMAEMPVVKEIYETYHKQGLEIIGISMDNIKPAWTKAIEKAALPWTHVSSLKGMKKCPIAALYQVYAIPKLYIIDKKGNIIAKDLRGVELKKKIAELFSTP